MKVNERNAKREREESAHASDRKSAQEKRQVTEQSEYVRTVLECFHPKHT